MVVRSGDHLSVVAGRAFEAYPLASDAFFFRDTVRTLRFVADASGKVEAMEIDEKIGPLARAVRLP